MPTVVGASGATNLQNQHHNDDQGQAGDFIDSSNKLESGVQLNLENLTKIDDKF